MEQPLLLIVALAAGAALGGLYFGGLWWTLSSLARRARRGRPGGGGLAAISLLVRLAMLGGGLYLVGLGGADRLVACGAGALLVRSLALFKLRRTAR